LRAFLLCILASLLLALPASAHEVLIVQSVRSAMYDEALKGFRGTTAVDSSTLVLSDYADPELARVISEERPRLVVAVGDGALASLRRIHHLPVVAMMALGLGSHGPDSANLTGVTLFEKPEQYLAIFKKLKSHRVGVVYDPARSGWYLKLARAAARQCGVELVLREVSDPRQTMGQLASLKGVVDALWLIPDPTAVTRETLEAYFLLAQTEAIPVVSFSSAHLRLGALAVIEPDRADMGRQAGEIARELLAGAPAAELPPSPPRKVSVKENEAVAKRLKLPLDLPGGLSKK